MIPSTYRCPCFDEIKFVVVVVSVEKISMGPHLDPRLRWSMNPCIIYVIYDVLYKSTSAPARPADTATATATISATAALPPLPPVPSDKSAGAGASLGITLVSQSSPVQAPTHTQFSPSGHEPCPWQRFRDSGHDGTSGTNAFAREQTTERSGHLTNPENGPSAPPGIGLLRP